MVGSDLPQGRRLGLAAGLGQWAARMERATAGGLNGGRNFTGQHDSLAPGERIKCRHR